MRTLDYNNADAHRLPILNKKNMINQTTTSLEKTMSDTPITETAIIKDLHGNEVLYEGCRIARATEMALLERELAEAKKEARKWEKLYDQDTEHLLSLQKRDNYGPIESLNEAAIRLSAELAEARRLNAQFLRERGEAEGDAEALTNELAEAQTTLQFAKKEYHALFREFSILVKQRDKLAKICAGIEQAYLEGSDSEWGNALMDIRLALAAIKGYEV
jgi:hypothetical protein